MADPIRGRLVQVVAQADCAAQWGNDGLLVLSTPAILGTMERACVDALAPTLRPGEMTVGTAVQLVHLAPTPVGDTVTYDVTIFGNGRRFDVEFVVTDSHGVVVSRGRHERALVDRVRFMQRITAAGAANGAER